MTIRKRLHSAWKRHSLSTILRLIVTNIVFYIRELFSGRLFNNAAEEKTQFDVIYRSDTDQIREVGSLDIESVNARYAVRYQPSPDSLVTEIIQSLPIDYSKFTFIDFGAGKGRVLLLAAQLPFAAVIGVEFSNELCKVASENISKIPPGKKSAREIACIYSDVADYPLPDTALVCYFYNPFAQPVMQTVLDKLTASLRHQQREIYIIYIDPKHRSLFDAAGYWDVTHESQFYIIYRANFDKFPEQV
ncbi:class I SAM-dependent methyltransferase [Nitrosomonas sp.]|uniref:class I SAM-dependent methyltransferase n=1 Tax=Nitrosomonas sp. TaxID=42353 RepID=UPI0020813973|nr:class I SAM-dependent methyltransferase [Nitrosomonas sp.]GJL74571.1 MAG: hypothetical protein NMNS02_06770 [Nitrosomonas sp.]